MSMTGNEAIKLGKDLYENITVKANNIIPTKKYIEFVEIAIKALSEIQQYRAIGTVEELQKKMEELERWNTDRINENIKNPFAYTSTLICHNCDHKDEYIEELESEDEEYHSVGTIEEFKDLKEKAEPKKVLGLSVSYEGKVGNCPCCYKFVAIHKEKYYCSCGQKLDWS